ncbi:hypothetical protein ACS0TY_029570 [Phlomoides rotata]
MGDVWDIRTPWTLSSLGEGYYNLCFSCDADRERIYARRSWKLKPGMLRLQRWVPDFNPYRVNTSVVQVWIRISELPFEYWNKHIITALASAVGTVIKIDERTLNQTMGHFARVLVELNLKQDRKDTLMFERAGHCFFVSVHYERLLDFCKFCNVIGHATGHCGRKPRQGKEPINSKSKEDPKHKEHEARGVVGGTKQWVQKTFSPDIVEGSTAGSVPAKESEMSGVVGVQCNNSFEVLADSTTEEQPLMDSIQEEHEEDQGPASDKSIPIF